GIVGYRAQPWAIYAEEPDPLTPMTDLPRLMLKCTIRKVCEPKDLLINLHCPALNQYRRLELCLAGVYLNDSIVGLFRYLGGPDSAYVVDISNCDYGGFRPKISRPKLDTSSRP